MIFEEYGFLNRKSSSAQVDMGPLLDMVFILLIFFVVTTNFNRQTGVEVQRPSAQNAVSVGQQVLMIGITQEGSFHVHGRQVTAEELELVVRREVAQRPDLSAVIVGDRNATIGSSVAVMDLCSRAGVRQVSIAAERQ